MSDRVPQPNHDSNGTAKQSMHRYQSAWMDHWRHTSCKPSIEAENGLRPCQRFNDDHADAKQHSLRCGPNRATSTSKFSQGLTEVSETKTVGIMNSSLKTSSCLKFGKESLDSQRFPLFNTSHNRMSVSLKNHDGTSSNTHSTDHETLTLGRGELAHPETKHSREFHFQPKTVSGDPERLLKSHDFLKENGLSISKSLQNDVGSSSKFVPHGLNGGGAQMQSFMCQKEETDQLTPFAASKEHLKDANGCSYSTFWVQEKKTGSLAESTKPWTSLAKLNNAPLLLHDSSTNSDQQPTFINKGCQKVEDHSGIGLLPSWCCPREAIKSGKEYHEYYPMPTICSVHDVEAMRICTTIDSMEEIPRGPPRFSQTTHQFFITKKTDVNFPPSIGKAFRNSTISSKFKGKMLGEFLSSSPGFSSHGQQGVKLQPLGSSTDSEGKENFGDVKTSSVCLKNESSAETNTMELDIFQKSHNSGAALYQPNQNIKAAQNSSTSRTATFSAREYTGSRLPNTKLPDINGELFAPPIVGSPEDDRQTSPSRTQSLDAEHLLSHAEQPTNSKSTACLDAPLVPEPSSRWVKRLKLNASDSLAHGTKSCKIGEASSQEKVKIFNKLLKCSMTSSEPTVGKCHAKPETALDQAAILLKNGDSSSTNSRIKSQDLILSHPWIQRWCYTRSTSRKRKAEAVVLCEPQSSKADELLKKQYPSIAAMALMGKAMSSFHPFEFRRRGSLTIWNT